MFSTATKRLVCALQAACRVQVQTRQCKTLSSTEFDVQEPQAWAYLRDLKTLLSERDKLKSGEISQANLKRLIVTGQLFEQAEQIADEMESLEQMKKEMVALGEKEMGVIAEKDLSDCQQKMRQLSERIFEHIAPIEALDTQEVFLEFTAGVGGQEAMLFNQDLMNMYLQFCSSTMGWRTAVVEDDEVDSGGLRHGTLSVSGVDVGRYLKLEGGVHRVQRVPATERTGRVHTSTATVAVLPVPSEVDSSIDPKDLIIKTKRASGPGGQHVNKTESAVQILHVPTGTMVECAAERSQLQNKQQAMRVLQAKLYDQKANALMQKINSQRKIQVGSAGRSEKIRTYNFLQDRVTDHRLPFSVHNLPGFLAGGPPLKQMIFKIQEVYRAQQIHHFIANKIYY